MSFNPNSPCIVGNEWFVTNDFSQFVNAEVSDAGTVDVLVESSATETVDSLWVYVDGGSGSSLERAFREGWYSAEVYPVSALGSFFPTTSQYSPTADTAQYSNAQVTLPDTGSTTADLVLGPPFFDKIDDLDVLVQGLFNAVSTYDNDWTSVQSGTVGFFSCYFGGIVGDLTGEQVLGVKLVGIADILGSGKGCTYRPFMLKGPRWDNGVTTISGPQPQGGRRLEGAWYVDPYFACPWTVDGVEEFDDSVATAAMGFVMDATGDASNYPVIYSMWLEVVHRPEVRAAVGCVTNFSRPGWYEIPLSEPDGTPGWAKTNGTDYLITIRRRGGSTPDGGTPIPILIGRQPNQTRGVAVNFDSLTKQPISYDDNIDGGPGIILDLTGTVSVDSQPYTSADGDIVPSLGIDDDWSVLDVSHSVTQTFTAPASAVFGHVRLLVRLQGDTTDGGIAVRLKSADGLTTLAGPLFFDDDDLLESPKTRYQVLEDFFNPQPAALVNGTVYRLEVVSWATDGNGWRLQVLSVVDGATPSYGDPPPGTQAVTFGSTTSQAKPNGATQDGLDACVTIAQVTETPANFTATAAPEVACVSHVTLSWDAVVLGCGTFAQYEIDRSEDAQASWQRIAEVTDQSVSTVGDYESIKNVEACYRIRARREDGTPSQWSAVQCATPLMTCCGYLFTSNWSPTHTVWYDDLVPRPYELIDDEETRHAKYAGRDLQRAYYAREYRGVRMKRTLLIAHEGGLLGTNTNPVPGEVAFDGIRIIAGKKKDPSTGQKVFLPYVAVHTQDGDRYFASVQVPTATRTEPGKDYEVDVIITEVESVPAPFDAAAAS